MSDPSNPQFWSMRLGSHPDRDDVSFDLESVLSSVVSLRANIPEDAFTAPILGTEREGQGVVIDNSGRVLTIGYLVTEAEEIWLIGTTTPHRVVVPQRDRYTITFFYNPSDETVNTPFSTCLDADNPLRFEPTTFIQYLKDYAEGNYLHQAEYAKRQNAAE